MGKNRKLLIIAGVAALLLVAFVTNPDQATHLKAITETIALRKPYSASSATAALMPLMRYHNYFIFSTVTFSDVDTTLTYGFLGKTWTTDGIGVLLNELYPN